MIGTLTKKYTASHCNFTAAPFHSTQWHGLTVLSCSVCSEHPLTYTLSQPLTSAASSKWFMSLGVCSPCRVGFSCKEKQIGFHSTQAVQGRRHNSTLPGLFAIVACIYLPCNAVYKCSKVHWMLLPITATYNHITADRMLKCIDPDAQNCTCMELAVECKSPLSPQKLGTSK